MGCNLKIRLFFQSKYLAGALVYIFFYYDVLKLFLSGFFSFEVCICQIYFMVKGCRKWSIFIFTRDGTKCMKF
jgi:hypothetical protein